MEGVKTFLESSSIHGLNYISTTQKYVRLLWIFVIITGFSVASLLIKESFDSWSESPVKTAIETLPIADIRFPKVTVCPPKNTFTDLNYDLMMTENITLTEEMRHEMFKYAVDVIDEDSYSENNWTTLVEEDRFYNWYHGYTQIKAPYYKYGALQIDLSTSATSGVVTTQYYGEKFRPELVERNLWYFVKVYPPKNVLGNENVTLHLKVEKVSMTGLVRPNGGSKDRVMMKGLGVLGDDQKTAYKNFTPQGDIPYTVYTMRDGVSNEDVESQNLDVMPGLKLSWWYTGEEITPDNKFKDQEITKQFVRCVKLSSKFCVYFYTFFS